MEMTTIRRDATPDTNHIVGVGNMVASSLECISSHTGIKSDTMKGNKNASGCTLAVHPREINHMGDKKIVPRQDTPRQLSLFDQLFDSRIRRDVIESRTHFSILDIFQHYGNKTNPTQSWKAVLNFLNKQGFDSTKIVDWRPDGKRSGKPTPMAPLNVILRIAQVTEFKEWEHLRTWMAETAHERIEEIADPELGIKRSYERARQIYQQRGLTDAWIEERFKTIDDYKLLCQSIDKVCTAPNYGVIVNSEYVALFGMMAAQLKKLLKAKSIRDSLPELQLSHLHTAEIGLRMILERSETMTTNAICEAAQTICKPLSDSLNAISQVLGIHPVTGQPLLESGNS